LENLRPSAFRTALLIDPPDPKTDITILEDDTDENKSVYILMLIRRAGDTYTLVRNLYFDRHSLQITRQKTFDAQGYITSQTRYSEWQTFAGVPFPTSIDIQRPQDNYELNLKVTDMKMNGPEVTTDKFVLVQPPNAQLKVLK
jgi:outer membrane lipoprotein-sorting protein